MRSRSASRSATPRRRRRDRRSPSGWSDRSCSSRAVRLRLGRWSAPRRPFEIIKRSDTSSRGPECRGCRTTVPVGGALRRCVGHRAQPPREPFVSRGAGPAELDGEAVLLGCGRRLPPGLVSTRIRVSVGSGGGRRVPPRADQLVAGPLPGGGSTGLHRGDVGRGPDVQPFRCAPSRGRASPRGSRRVTDAGSGPARAAGTRARLSRHGGPHQSIRWQPHRAVERERVRRGRGLGPSAWAAE